MTDVLLAGSRVRSERSDAETRPVVAALAERGLTAAVRSWDDPEVDWGSARLVAVRTTWDYTERLDDFLAWARRVAAATVLCNPPDVLAWNAHKRYLVELAESGVPTVPTVVVPRGTSVGEQEAALGSVSGSGSIVVKPAVGAGGRGTHLGGAAELAAVVAELTAAGDVLVQPAVDSVRREGETSLVALGGRWSHAVRKVPASGGFLVHERHGGRIEEHTPTSSELATADAAIARAPGPVHAARVDLVRLGGESVVMELELIEPELFLRRRADAADQLAAAYVDVLA